MDRKIIAVCASWEDVENLNLVLSYLIEAAGERGYLPMCVCFDRDSLEARGAQSLGEFLSAFDVPGLAGFLLFGEMIRSDIINTRLIELARKKALPVFMLEREYEGCVNMALSYGKGFEAVARHLVKDHGCRDVVMVAGLRDNPYSEERIRLCRQVLEENGSALPPERVIYGDFWDEPTMRALDGYFAGGGQMPEAFICANDAMAIAVCIYLAERDIQVPGQVRVSGFDGIVQGENHDPTITTAKPDYLGMFERMLDRVSAWKAEEAGGTEVWPIPFELKCRESCGCAGRNAFESTKRISSLKDLNLAYARHIRTMGGFIRRILNKNTLDGLAECLPPLFSLWQRPYDFAAILAEQESGAALPILHGVHSRYTSDGVFQWRGTLLTDFDALRADASVRIVVAQLLQNKEETLGYLVSGMGEWNQWEQECFEEQAIFLAAALHAVVSNHRLEKANRAITRMAEHDYLTGLYNRRGFLRELERRLRLKESQSLTLTLFAMDMDRLKHINDAYGHHEGDYAIQCLAKAIQSQTEGLGICARYGGDEFAFALLAEDSFLPELEAIRARIEARAQEICGSRAYRISASLGATSRPVSARPSLDELLQEADDALYADKKRRRSKESNSRQTV